MSNHPVFLPFWNHYHIFVRMIVPPTGLLALGPGLVLSVPYNINVGSVLTFNRKVTEQRLISSMKACDSLRVEIGWFHMEDAS
jgi:hypothetical protein